MKHLDLTYKNLQDATWQTHVQRYRLKDNGLSKSLTDCGKHAEKDDYDSLLKSLALANDCAKRLRADKAVAAHHDVCSYLDNLTRETEKARATVATEKSHAAKAKAETYKKAEEQESDADEKKLLKAIGVEIAAGLQKAKTTECPVLIYPATPMCGLIVTGRVTAQHKAYLAEFTGSTKCLLSTCVWDDEKQAYCFIMAKRDVQLEAQLKAAIYFFAKQSVKVCVITKAEYEASQTEEEVEPSNEDEGSESGAESSDSSEASDDSSADEDGLENARRTGEPDEEPLLTGVRPFDISGSVGQGGKNVPDDVQQVQIALNRKGARLEIDGKIGPKTIQAIRDFQKKIGLPHVDGLVEVGKKTAAALAGSGSGAQYAPTGGGNYGGGSKPYGGGGTGGNYSGGGKPYGGGGSSGNYSGGGKPYTGKTGENYGSGSGGNYGSGGKPYTGKAGENYGGGGGNYGGGGKPYSGKAGENYGGSGGYSGGGDSGYRKTSETYGTSGGAGATDNVRGQAGESTDGIDDRVREAADNVYEQRKAQAEQKINEGINTVEDALLPDNDRDGGLAPGFKEE